MIQRLIKTLCGALAAVALLHTGAQAQNPPQLNEIYASHSGTDFYEYIELKGTPGLSLDNYLVLVVEGEGSATNQGTLDRAWDLTTYSIPTSGYFVLGDTNMNLSTSAPYTPDFDIGTQDRLENGTETFYLINANNAVNAAAITAMLGTDTDPDGNLSTTIVAVPGITVVEIMAIVDCDTQFLYGTNTLLDHVFDNPTTIIGPDGICQAPPMAPGGFFPAGAFRGLDAAWCPDEYPDFNEIANLTVPRTPGAANSACPSANPFVNYCTAGTTTNGCTATMGATGTPSVSATSGFNVTVNNVEGQKNGIIFYGTAGPVATPWGLGGTSYLCVKSPTQRTGSQLTGGTAGACNGTMSLDLLAYLNANPGALGNPFSAGQQCWIQGWFRDPPAVKTTSLSDGLDVTFQP